MTAWSRSQSRTAAWVSRVAKSTESGNATIGLAMSAPSRAPGWDCTWSMRSSGNTEAGSRSRARKARAHAWWSSCPSAALVMQRSSAMHRILCVEDDEETRSLLEEALTELGYAVELAPDGEGGLAQVLVRPPDLILCDVRMPRMSGFEL